MDSIKEYTDLDKKISFIICSHLVITNCKNMLVGTSKFFYGINNLLNNSILIAIIGIYLWLFLDKRIYKRISYKTLYVVLFCVLFILISCIVDPKLFTSNSFPYNYVIIQFRTFIAYCLPLFFAVSLLNNYEDILEKLLGTTYIMFIFATVGFLCSIIPTLAVDTSRATEYSMGYGNATLLISLLLLYKMKKNHNMFVILQFISTCMYIILSGSRGPVLVIAIAIIIALFYNSDIKKKKAFTYFLVFVIAIVCIVNYEVIIYSLIKYLQKYNIESRTLNLFVSKHQFYDSGRSVYYDVVRNALEKSPILGLGAFGGEARVGLTHSLYLDIFANFGYFFGTLYIIYIIFHGCIVLKKEKNTAYGIILLILFVMVFPRGFFSESFWTSKELWMIMGMYIGYHRVISNRIRYNSITKIEQGGKEIG